MSSTTSYNVRVYQVDPQNPKTCKLLSEMKQSSTSVHRAFDAVKALLHMTYGSKLRSINIGVNETIVATVDLK